MATMAAAMMMTMLMTKLMITRRMKCRRPHLHQLLLPPLAVAAVRLNPKGGTRATLLLPPLLLLW